MDAVIQTALGGTIVFICGSAVRLYAIHMAFRQGHIQRLRITIRGLEIEMESQEGTTAATLRTKRKRISTRTV